MIIRALTHILYVALLLLTTVSVSAIELSVRVLDRRGKPLTGVRLGTRGDGSISTPTAKDGSTRIVLGQDNKPGDWVTLTIVAPDDLTFYSPWQGRIRVPPPERKEPQKIVLARKGDAVLLTDPLALSGVAARATTAGFAIAHGRKLTNKERKQAIADAAVDYGLKPEDLEAALQTLSAGNGDAFGRAYAAFLRGDDDKAVGILSVLVTESSSQADAERARIAVAFSTLADIHHTHDRYAEAIKGFRRSLELKPDDPNVMDHLGLSLLATGDAAAARETFHRSAETFRKNKDRSNPMLAYALADEAIAADAAGDSTAAVKRIAEAVNVAAEISPSSAQLGVLLDDQGVLLRHYGDLDGSEKASNRAIEMIGTTEGKESADYAIALNNRALVLVTKGQLAGAEQWLREALTLLKASVGSDSLQAARAEVTLGAVLYQRGARDEAVEVLTEALAILEQHLGPDHPDVRATRADLTVVRGKS